MQNEGSVDPDLERLRKKSQKGAKNVVTEVLADPEIQDIIKKNIVKQTFSSGLVMASFFIGLMILYNTAKTTIGFDWKGDVPIGIILVSIGLIYMLKNTVIKKENGESKTSRGNSDVG